MNLENAIPLTDETLQQITASDLSLPFVILNVDMANEPRAHKIRCSYTDINRTDGMKPNSKTQNETGNHWLILDSLLPQNATKNCRCWD